MYFYDFFQFSLIEDIIGWLVMVIFYFLFSIKAAGPKNITHISFYWCWLTLKVWAQSNFCLNFALWDSNQLVFNPNIRFLEVYSFLESLKTNSFIVKFWFKGFKLAPFSQNSSFGLKWAYKSVI